MPEVSDAANGVTNLDWRPKMIADVYTHEGVSKIMAWFEEMRVYELKGAAKKGSGLRRPDDLILDDEYVQPEARGRAWYLLDHVRSAGAEPIVPLEEAARFGTSGDDEDLGLGVKDQAAQQNSKGTQRDAFAGFHNGRHCRRTRSQTSSQRSCSSANLA